MGVKTLGLLSGGLDSALATRIMTSLGFEVTALNFSSPFCNCTRKDHGCRNEARRLADELGIVARVEFLGQEYIDLVRNPRFGYGKNMNPCVDCRIMIFKKAKTVMEQIGAAFIFTGEVVGQRPMSQKLDRLRLIDREAGLTGRVVRPLSARLLEPTLPEREGLIDREKMLAIHGRSRKEQIRISREDFGVTENLCSSGGCMLTDEHFAGRMKDLLDHDDDASVKDARLLRLGRHFRVADGVKLVVGRNHDENQKLERMAAPGDFLFYPASHEVKGPLSVARGSFGKEELARVGQVVARYCKGANGKSIEIHYRRKQSESAWTITATPATDEQIDGWRV